MPNACISLMGLGRARGAPAHPSAAHETAETEAAGGPSRAQGRVSLQRSVARPRLPDGGSPVWPRYRYLCRPLPKPPSQPHVQELWLQLRVAAELPSARTQLSARAVQYKRRPRPSGLRRYRWPDRLPMTGLPPAPPPSASFVPRGRRRARSSASS